MADYTNYLDRVAELQTAERINARRTPYDAGHHRPHGRHALASRLRALADRIDG